MCDSIDFVCQLISDSSDLAVKWFEVQVSWLSTDVWFKLFCQTKLFCETSFKIEALKLKNEAFLQDFLQKRSFEDQKPSISARLPSKLKLWRSKTKLLCETSFKIEISKLKNEAFLRDFLQNWSFEAPKRSFSARLPSKLKLWSSKTKLFCKTSFKNEALKIKNQAFLRDFLQNWSFEDQKRSFCARLPSKLTCWANTWPQNSNTFSRFFSGCFKSTAPATKKLSRGIRSPVTATRNDPCKVTLPWHEICNPPTDSRQMLQTSTSQSTKSLRLPREKHRFGASSNPPRLPTFLQPSRTPAPATYFATCRNPCACHAKHTLNLKKRPETVSF